MISTYQNSESPLRASDFAIVCSYEGQVELIREYLGKAESPLVNDVWISDDIGCLTVDGAKGLERHIVVYVVTANGAPKVIEDNDPEAEGRTGGSSECLFVM